MLFKVTNKDNKGNAIFIQGALSKNSNNDVARITFQNYDEDTKVVYNMAGVSARDAFGTSASNGIGDLLFLTNNDGGSNMTEKMRLKYNGQLCLGNNVPLAVTKTDALCSVYGGVTITCNLNVFNASTFCNDVTCIGNITVGASMAIASNVVVGNDFINVGNLHVYKTLVVNSNVSVSNDLFVTSNATFGKVSVNGIQSAHTNLSAFTVTQFGGGDVMKIGISNALSNIVSIAVTSNGNIGFNTPTPFYKLDVNGVSRVTADGAGNGSVRICPTTTSNESSIGFYTSSNLEGTYWLIGQNTYEIGPNNFGIGTQSNHVMVFSNNGYVGIGTSNPKKKLDINGDINFEGMLYQNNVAFPREPIVHTFRKTNIKKNIKFYYLGSMIYLLATLGT
jgi:hypothetical protein